MRGVLNEKIQALAKTCLGREITTKELRLYPFIDYCLKNGGYMDRNKLDNEELCILKGYKDNQLQRKHGYIFCSYNFYIYLQNVLWLSYIDTPIKENENE